MALIRKDVLWCGRWDYPHCTLNVRPRDIGRAVANGNRMLKSGIGVKWCWEHQPEAFPKPVEVWADELDDPERRAAWAKSIITDVAGFELGYRDGKPIVVAAFDDAKLTPAEIDAIRRVGKVSSRLDFNYRETRRGGLQFPGLSISHIAVTPKPVHHQQGSFEMGRSRWTAARTFYMSEGTFMAGKSEDDDLPSEKKPGDGDSSKEAPKDDGNDAGGDDQNAGGRGAKFKRLLNNLAALGLTTTDVVTDIDSLNIALETLSANGVSLSTTGDDSNLDPEAPPDVTTANGGPVMMSEVAMRKSNAKRVKLDREEVEAEIRALSRQGKLPVFATNKLLDQFGKFDMSYSGTTGKPVERGVLAVVKAIGDFIPKGTFLKKGGQPIDMSAVGKKGTEQGKPPEQFDKPSAHQQEADKLAADVRKLAEQGNPAGAKN